VELSVCVCIVVMSPHPHPPPAQSIDDDASIHDRLLWAIHLSGMDDLLLFLSSSSAEQQWSLHVLEIISLMFRDQVGPYLY
jgi:timeless